MSKIMFSDAAGPLADLQQKLGGENGDEYLDGLKKFLRRENPFEKPEAVAALVAAPSVVVGQSPGGKWEDRDGVIYVTLPASEGVTGPQWIGRLKRKGIELSDDAKKVLKSKDFKPTTGVVHKLAILSAKFWKSDSERTTSAIRAEGQKRKSEGWRELNPEAICILRENFSNEELKEMGFWWIVGVHEPIEVYGDPRWLGADRSDGGRGLNTRVGLARTTAGATAGRLPGPSRKKISPRNLEFSAPALGSLELSSFAQKTVVFPPKNRIKMMRFSYARISAVVGEYEGGCKIFLGFFLPNPVSMRRECLGPRLDTEWRM